MELEEYMDKQENLPEIIKDFHDQKKLFKHIYKNVQENKVMSNMSWWDTHVYTIDYFLYWMGLHGYKLQKTRKKGVEFLDPIETLKALDDEKRP